MLEIYCYSSMEGIVTSMTSDLQCGLLSPHDSEMRGDKFSQALTRYTQSTYNQSPNEDFLTQVTD